MKKQLLAVVAATFALGGSAMAADLAVRGPVYKAPPLPPPVYFSWTGCYVGGHVGGLWARKEWHDREPFSATFGLSDGGHDADGLLFGVQGGCDYQFAGGWVIGIPATMPGPTPRAATPAFCSRALPITPRSNHWRR